MIVRALDPGGDWLFGKGRNDYLKDDAAIAQSIATRLRSFLGDCFFDQGAGIDWFNLNGAKNMLALDLAIKAVILNTENVTGLVELSTDLNSARHATFTYEVTTVFPRTIRSTFGFLLTEDGDFLITEDGERIHA